MFSDSITSNIIRNTFHPKFANSTIKIAAMIMMLSEFEQHEKKEQHFEVREQSWSSLG
tara:strand:- start:330 stop:503 length:174 start_codon:yes stop_codon:yes gene_type:complete